jgi:hypothetical protein
LRVIKAPDDYLIKKYEKKVNAGVLGKNASFREKGRDAFSLRKPRAYRFPEQYISEAVTWG